MYRKVHKESRGGEEVPIWERADLGLLSELKMTLEDYDYELILAIDH